MKIDEYFDKIYCINLDRRKDRRVVCIEFFKKYNIENYEFFDAVDGNEIRQDKLLNLLPNNESYNRGATGCFMSHINLLNLIKVSQYENVLILEDDFEFVEDFDLKFEKYIEELNGINYDMLYLGGTFSLEPIKVRNYLYKNVKTLTTHSYSIKKDKINTILEMIQHNTDKAIDTIYLEFQENFNTFIFMPNLIFQRKSFSDIANSVVEYKFRK